MRYINDMAIQSFADKEAEAFFIHGKATKKTGWIQVQNIVKRKLDMMHYSTELSDLRSPPGNRLEVLKHDRKGYHSIRINDKWRIIFEWTEAGPEKVAVVDYHRG